MGRETGRGADVSHEFEDDIKLLESESLPDSKVMGKASLLEAKIVERMQSVKHTAAVRNLQQCLTDISRVVLKRLGVSYTSYNPLTIMAAAKRKANVWAEIGGEAIKLMKLSHGVQLLSSALLADMPVKPVKPKPDTPPDSRKDNSKPVVKPSPIIPEPPHPDTPVETRKKLTARLLEHKKPMSLPSLVAEADFAEMVDNLFVLAMMASKGEVGLETARGSDMPHVVSKTFENAGRTGSFKAVERGDKQSGGKTEEDRRATVLSFSSINLEGFLNIARQEGVRGDLM
uniref:Non-structural maintenance of chromosomes element 4 n=1 Tax=Palpitomonas bilix TaxID=652834 RepID=A0A7S3D0L3_9EUKA|mmetsp:Transcript_16245/g.41154  ORF Transcript_16245/g.41154 Transcript_16245/m.41154 type:complete len:287 (+) Transcript_16245:192-1052(+)